MIQEDFITLNQNNPINNDILDEEVVIRSVFTPCYKRLESWNSKNSNDIYFIKESSKFSENEQKESILNRNDSFNSMQNFDDALNNLIRSNEDDINNLSPEKEEVRLINQENESENIHHFKKVPIIFANALNERDEVVIKIKDPDNIAKKIQEETSFIKIETVIPIKEILNPCKKIKVKINGRCFPFTAGKGILTEDINDNKIKQYMEKTTFMTNKYITDNKGNKKREKKQRKYKPDDIRKKIKVRFHKKLKNILNESLKKAGSKVLFRFLPQFFIGNISKTFNYQYMNTTLEELLSINFSDFQKEYPNKECDYNQFDKNKKTLEYLKNNPEISEISGFNRMKKMKYRDLLYAYFSSLEFEHSIEQLENEKETAEYIQEYIYFAKSYIEYFTSSDDNL